MLCLDDIVKLLGGSFIYIAAADLLPAIKQQPSLRRSIVRFTIFLLGIVIMLRIK